MPHRRRLINDRGAGSTKSRQDICIKSKQRRFAGLLLLCALCLMLVGLLWNSQLTLFTQETLGRSPISEDSAHFRVLTFSEQSSSNGLFSNGTYSNSTFSNNRSTNGTSPHRIEPNVNIPPRVLCVNFVGRLGNQLFQYAAVIGLSLKQRRIPVYNPSGELNSALSVPPPTGNRNQYLSRCQSAPVVSEKVCCKAEATFLQLDPAKDFRIADYTYLQSWKYFEGHEEDIRKAVQFRSDVQSLADRTVKEFRRNYNSTLVGMHVRRGDYLKQEHVNIGYLVATSQYFVKAMNYFREKFRNVTFIVSIDDETWFRQTVRDAVDVIYIRRQTPAVDMAVLSSLDHAIISVGTYSWWVGFLNRGVTVYYKDFIAPNTVIGNMFNPDGSEYIYPGWIPL